MVLKKYRCGVEIKVTVFFISILLSSSVLSETYICSSELSNYGRPGEIETVILERNDNYFNYEYMDHVGIDEFEIILETESLIILTDVFQKNTLDVVFLNKKTKEYGRRFNSMEDFKDPKVPSYGKCVVIN